MLVIIVSSLIFTEIKKRSFSDTVAELWNQWELRMSVFLSLLLQFFHLISGNRQKYTVTSWRAFSLWSAYLLTDWVVNVSLTTLLNDQEGCSTSSSDPNPNKALMIFWAPFLLMHLGGPDTITAYALEDNELWARLLPGLVYHVGIVSFLFKFQTSSALIGIAIPIYIAGIIKYGERIWSRWSASAEKFRNSILAPEPTPFNLIRDGNETKSRKKYGNQSVELLDLNTYLDRQKIIGDAKHLYEGFLSFKMFTPLFSDLAFRLYKQQCNIIFTPPRPTLSPAEVFKRVEIELGYVYDFFYTKATVVHSRLGPIRQSFYFLSSVIALVVFHFNINKHDYSNIDKGITYMLLSGAVFLELYAFILNLISNRTMLWMTKHKNNMVVFVYGAIVSLSYGQGRPESMAQHNLIRFRLEAKVIMSFGVHKFLNAYNILAKYFYTTRKDIDDDLKCLIYSKTKEKHSLYLKENFKYECLKKLLAERGDHVLKEYGAYQDFRWSIDMVAFDQSLLLWHIATDLCYYDDLNHNGDANDLDSKCKMSKALSDYMLYLLVECSFMMPKGISEVRHRDTCREVMGLLRDASKSDFSKAAAILLQLDSEFPPPDLPEIPKNKSVLFNGIDLVQGLQSLVTESRWDHEEKWKMISEVWVEMLTYAASHCGWKQHAKQLSQGKELLTHVCLLVAHLGLSEQIHIVDLNTDRDHDDIVIYPFGVGIIWMTWFITWFNKDSSWLV